MDKTGLLKYKVRLPNSVIIIPPIRGTYGIFFSTKYITATATMVATIKGGIAADRLFPLL